LLVAMQVDVASFAERAVHVHRNDALFLAHRCLPARQGLLVSWEQRIRPPISPVLLTSSFFANGTGGK
jgi:hypothetical protein